MIHISNSGVVFPRNGDPMIFLSGDLYSSICSLNFYFIKKLCLLRSRFIIGMGFGHSDLDLIVILIFLL